MIRMLDLQIIGKCNLKCKFCCGAPKNIIEQPFYVVKKVIDKLKVINIERIVITGGEPLIYPDIDEVIKYIYDCGIEIYLSTNAYFLDKHFETIIKYVSCIGIPLDGSNSSICSEMTRKGDQLSVTISAINKIKSANPKIKVKIGTVVSKINIDDLQNIKEILCNNNYIPDVWRLYEFSPLGDGKINRRQFEIKTKDFIEATDRLKENECPILISTLTNEDSNDAYIFIHPNMDIILLTNDEYKKVGNATEMSVEELENLFQNQSTILKHQEKNRKWLNKE